jgi:hypothetical protein
VEADLPYVNLRTAMLQKHLNMYPYDPIVHELKHLIHDIEKESVDHPDQDPFGGPGRKDVADSLCGAYTALVRALAATKVTNASPTTVNLGHLRSPGTVQQPSDQVKEVFKGLVPEIPESITGHETDRFITADYSEHPKQAKLDEVLKRWEADEEAARRKKEEP